MLLREDWHRGPHSPLTVDRDKQIIYGIKILGWESQNGRFYDPLAAKKAISLYEGVKAYSNHPPKSAGATATRLNEDLLGIWHNPRWQPDGVYADLHYRASAKDIAGILEDAERGAGFYGASHNADGKVEMRDGKPVVIEIGEVRSVDFVTDPATVSNLREGKTIADKITVSALLKKALPDLDAKRKPLLEALLKGQKSRLELLEADDDGGDHKDHLYRAMRACEDAEDGGEMAGKIHKLLAPDKKDDDEDEDKLKEEDDEGFKDKEDPAVSVADDPNLAKKEGRQRKSTGATLTESMAKDQCELAGMKATAGLLESLTGMDIGKAVKLLKEMKAQNPAPQRTNAPRSSGYVPVPEGAVPKDINRVGAWLNDR